MCLPTTHVTEIKKPILKYTLNKYNVHWLFSFKHLKLPISMYENTCHYMTNCLYLHGSYITKFDFMNYALAELVDAW